MTTKTKEYLPTPGKPIWLLFDLGNGTWVSKRYVWWFESRTAARNHRKWQLKQKYPVALSQPMKYSPAE